MPDLAQLEIRVRSLEAIQAKTDLDNLSLSADRAEKEVTQLGVAAQRNQASLRGMSATTALLARGIDGLEGQVKQLALQIGGGLALTALVTKFAMLIPQTISAADNLFDLSKRTGIAVEDLSNLSIVAEQTGTSITSVANALKVFTKNLVEFQRTGKGEGSDAIRRLGPDFLRAAQEGKSLLDLLQQVSTAFQNLDENVQVELAQKLFGRAGNEIVPFLQVLAEELDRVRKLNLATTTEVANAADRLGDNVTELKRRFKRGAIEESFLIDGLNLLVVGLNKADKAVSEWADSVTANYKRGANFLFGGIEEGATNAIQRLGLLQKQAEGMTTKAPVPGANAGDITDLEGAAFLERKRLDDMIRSSQSQFMADLKFPAPPGKDFAELLKEQAAAKKAGTLDKDDEISEEVKDRSAALDKVQAMVEALEAETNALGLSAEEREVNLKIMEAEKTLREALGETATEEIDSIDAIVEALRKQGDEYLKTSKAAKEAADKKRETETIETGLQEQLTQLRAEREALEATTDARNVSTQAIQAEIAAKRAGTETARNLAEEIAAEEAAINKALIARDKALEKRRKVVEGVDTLSNAFASFSVAAVNDIKNVEDAVESLAKTLANEALGNATKQLVQGLLSSLAGTSGGGSGNATGSVIGSLFASSSAASYAHGGVTQVKMEDDSRKVQRYAHGGVTRFASGGGVMFDRPTEFQTSEGVGRAGENWDEMGIFPVARLPNGRLGIESAGGGGTTINNYSVNVKTPDVAGFRKSKRQVAADLRGLTQKGR